MKTEEKKRDYLDLDNEPQWLIDRRSSALEEYNNSPLPDRVLHLWKYSDPKWFELNDYEVSHGKKDELVCLFELNEEAKNKGVIFEDIKNVLKSREDLLKKNFNKPLNINPSKFDFLNEAVWSCGYFLYVPKDVKLEKPIIVKTTNIQNNKLTALRVLIIQEENSEINLIDSMNSNDEQGLLNNIAIEIFLSKGAKLNYLNIQTNGNQTIQHLCQRAELESHAELTNLIVALGGKISKSDLGTKLNGINSSVSTYGIVLGDEKQKYDHHTRIEHNSPYTKSDLNFRVVLKDKATSAFTGNLKILNEAVKSDAYQENRNLLLSGEARAESIPELEILTNDVIRCSHGVTIGQVDKDQIYYLMSRGLDRDEAERLIIEGFLEPTISRVQEESLKEEIFKKINHKLERL